MTRHPIYKEVDRTCMGEIGDHPATGYVYFAEHPIGGLIKIGFTTRDVHVRLREVSSATGAKVRLIDMIPACHRVERRWHARFVNSRAVGEWFRPSIELLRSLKNIEYGGWDEVHCPAWGGQ